VRQDGHVTDKNEHPLIEQYYAAMVSGDDVRLGALYADEALVIRFAGSVRGRNAITDFLRGVRAEHKPFELQAVTQVRATDDIVMWDALITTSVGVLQTTDVVVVDSDGLIDHHVLGNRGYWGR